jgi:hypothetical protein
MTLPVMITVIVTAVIAGAASALAGHWAFRRSFGSRLAALEAVVLAGTRPGPPPTASGRSDARLARDSERDRDRDRERDRDRDRERERERAVAGPRPAPGGPLAGPLAGDPLGTRVVSGAARPARGAPAPTMALARVARAALSAGRASGIVSAPRPAAGTGGKAAAMLVVRPGNSEPSRIVLTGDRSSWRVGSAPDADIVIADASVDVLIGRNADVWTAASEGPILGNVTLDAVTLPTVPMPWPPKRKLRVGAVTMTLEGIDGPPPTLEDLSNQTHASLAGRYAAHANNYALALARSGKERAESVTAAALACFDSRLLDPARGAALAAMNMTLARRPHGDSPALDQSPAELFIGIAGFDRSGRLRAAANFPIAVWAVTDTGSVPLGQLGTAGVSSPLEVVTCPIDDEALSSSDRPLLLIAAGPDLSVVGERIRNLSTLNATAAQLTAAVLGPAGTDAPIAAAAAARACAL